MYIKVHIQLSQQPLYAVVWVIHKRTRGVKTAGEEEDEQNGSAVSCVHSERQLQAWWQYALSPRHDVSAAVAVCSVKGEGNGGVGLLTYLYSRPLSRKGN